MSGETSGGADVRETSDAHGATTPPDLDCYLAGDIEIDFDAEPSALCDIDQADYALRRIARIDHEMKRNEAVARRQVEQVQAWLHGRSDILLSQREWWERSAEGWMRSHNAETGTKTEKLPHGTLSLRSAKPRVEPTVREPDEGIDARLVRVKREWDKRAVSDACKPGPELDAEDVEGFTVHAAVDANGEVVNGVTFLVPVADSFSLKAGE